MSGDVAATKPALGMTGLVNRATGERPGVAPEKTTPSSSGDGSVSQGAPGSFAYKHQETDSASSLGSLIDNDQVADFVEPRRVPEKIPHKATGAACGANNDASRPRRRHRRFFYQACGTPRRLTVRPDWCFRTTSHESHVNLTRPLHHNANPPGSPA